MIPMLATSSPIEPPTFIHVRSAVPLITVLANVSESPWFYSALTQVREIENSGELIPGLGDLRVTEETGNLARMLLSSIEIKDLPAPVVSPVSGGGLSITWVVGQKEVKYAFDPNAPIMFFKIEDDEISADGPVDIRNRDQVARQLQWMLDGQL